MKKLLQNTINRRTFINSAVAGATAIGSGMAMTGVAKATPKSGGTLRIASNGASTTDTFDATTNGNNWTYLLWSTYSNKLVHLNNDNILEGELATDWFVSNDGMTWTFNLRKGVEFHDGSEFTADDALWTLMRHIAPGSKSGAKGQMVSWEKVTKTSKYQIKIHLKSPDSDTPYVLNQARLPMDKAGATNWNMPNGTGAYKVKVHEPGVKVILEKHKNYFKSDAGYFDDVEIIAINDDTSRINALLSGSVDVIREIPFELTDKIRAHSRFNVVDSDVGQYWCNDMSCVKGFTKDNNVRLALKYATDRQAIIDTALNGYGSMGNDHQLHKSDSLFDASHKQRPYDPDKASYYWKKAGMGSEEVEYHTSSAGTYAGSIKHATVMQQSFKKAGINLKIVNNPADGYWSDIWKKKPFVASYWGRRPTAITTFGNNGVTGARGNSTFFSDAEFDGLLAKLKKENNYSNRKEIAGKMQRIMSDRGGFGIPVFFNVIDAASSKVMGMDKHSLFGLNGYRIAEKGWFA